MDGPAHLIRLFVQQTHNLLQQNTLLALLADAASRFSPDLSVKKGLYNVPCLGRGPK